MNRRTFYLSCIYIAWAIISGALAFLGGIYLLWPPPLRKEQEWVEAGSLAELHPKTPRELVFRRSRLDGWKMTLERATAWVVKMADNRVVAFAPRCPHLACGYHWDAKNQEFVCPCHASTFSMEGEVLAGPAQRALDRYEVKVEGNKLFLRIATRLVEPPR